VNDTRLAKGREILASTSAVRRGREAYGVDRYAIAAIWGSNPKRFATKGRSERAAIDPATALALRRPSRQSISAMTFLSAAEILITRFQPRNR